MYSYVAYDLTIHSALPLPELQPAPAARADVVIELGKVERPLRETVPGDDRSWMTAQEACFFWDEVGAFRVRGGREIVVESARGAPEQLVRLPLLGTVLAVLLHQRGLLVLHASAVAVDGQAVAFLGRKGQGKSTMAAALYARGHTLLADDVVAIDMSRAATPLVLPGFPQLKLYPEAAASSLGEDPDRLPRLAALVEKRACRVTERFSERPVPLARLYALTEGPAPALRPLEPREALLHLIANSYVARFGKRLLHGMEASSHLRHCTTLLKSAATYSLSRPVALPLLPVIAALVEDQRRPRTPVVESCLP